MQVRVRVAGEGSDIKTLTEGATVKDALGDRGAGIVRVNGTVIENPASFKLADGDVVEWTVAGKGN